MRLIRVYLTMPREYRQVLPRVLGLVILVRIALWVLPYRVVRAFLDSLAQRPPILEPTAEDRQHWKAIVWAADTVGKRLLRKKPCLVQAHVAHWFLARAGCQTEIRIGVSMEAGEFKAHAWLEREGGIVLGGGDSPDRYTPLKPLRAEAGVAC